MSQLRPIHRSKRMLAALLALLVFGATAAPVLATMECSLSGRIITAWYGVEACMELPANGDATEVSMDCCIFTVAAAGLEQGMLSAASNTDRVLAHAAVAPGPVCQTYLPAGLLTLRRTVPAPPLPHRGVIALRTFRI